MLLCRWPITGAAAIRHRMARGAGFVTKILQPV
jgi:hypothetical protein